MLVGLGRSIISLFVHLGRVILLFSQVVASAPKIFHSPRLTFEQLVAVGLQSLPLVFVISVFGGATAAWQARYQLLGLVPDYTIGTAVWKSMVLELGPVLTGLVVAGRVGSSIAAELATMRVTEQIDALTTMSISPVRYLLLPRVTAGVVMTPILTIYANLFGLFGGYATAVWLGNISHYSFIEGVKMFFYGRDVAVGLVKAYTFGIALSFMGCYFGYIAEGGAEGVGEAAIKSFVTTAVVILLADFFVALIAFS